MIPGKSYAPEDFVRIAWRRKWLIILPAIAIASGVVMWTRTLKDVYRSDTLILVVPQRVPETYVRSTVSTRIEDRLQTISQQILSRSRLERTIQDFNLYPELRKTQLMEDIVEQMRRDIGIQIVKGDAFRVSFSSESPRTAMRVTERLASLFIDESLRDRETLAEGTNQFLESQLEDARRRLLDNESRLREYRSKHSGELPNQAEANLQGLHNVEMQLQALLDSMSRDKDRRLMLERQIAEAEDASNLLVDSTSATAAASGPPGSAADELRKAEDQLKALELRLKPEHPDIKRMKSFIKELQARAELEAADRPVSGPARLSPAEQQRQARKAELEKLDKDITDKSESEKRLRATIGEYQARLEATPLREGELIEITRDYDTIQQSYRSLLAKKEDSQMSANLERRQIGEQFRILDPPQLPQKPYSPDRPRFYLLGLAAALGVGLGFAALAEYFDRGMRSEEDVQVALGLPVLATVPILAQSRFTRRRSKNIAAAIAWLVAGASAMGTVLGRLG